MTQLTTHPNETYAVIVPKDAKDFDIDYEMKSIPEPFLTWTVLSESIGYRLPFETMTEDYSILGTVTSESIDFDVSGIVECDRRLLPFVYKNYVNDTIAEDSHDSFRSLLKSKKVEIGENEQALIIQKR